MLKLASNNPNPQQPSRFTLLAAIVARAMMTESAPASFFRGGCAANRDGQMPVLPS